MIEKGSAMRGFFKNSIRIARYKCAHTNKINKVAKNNNAIPIYECMQMIPIIRIQELVLFVSLVQLVY